MQINFSFYLFSLFQQTKRENMKTLQNKIAGIYLSKIKRSINKKYQHRFLMNNFRQSFLDQGAYSKPTERDITNLLIRIQAKPHQIKNYRQLLQKKQEYEKYNTIVTGGFQRINEIIDPKANRVSLNNQQSVQSETHEVGGICPSCFEQIRGKGTFCNGCKKVVCRNCIIRNRVMKNDALQKFCQKCDLRYLQAQIDKEFLKEFVLYQRGFDVLVRQQEALDTLLSTQKQKLKGQQLSKEKQEILRNSQQILKRKHQKQTLQQKVQQLQNKVDWGQSMTKGLRVKYRKLKKLMKQSFGSSNSDSAYIEWQPPKAQDDISMDEENINQSFITTKFEKTPEEEDVEEVDEREFCRCGIY